TYLQYQAQQNPAQAQQAAGPAGMHGRSRLSGAQVVEGALPLLSGKGLNAAIIEMGPGEALGTKELDRLTEVERVIVKRQMELARSLSEAKAPAGVELEQQGPQAVGQVKGINVYSSVAEVRDLTICAGEIPHVPERPLVLFKWASAQSALVGD